MGSEIKNDSEIMNNSEKSTKNDSTNENNQHDDGLKKAFKRRAEIFQDMCDDYPDVKK